MPAHAPAWRAAGYTNVNVIPNPQWVDGEFDRNWTERGGTGSFVLSGADEWRGDDPTRLGLDIWEQICREFLSSPSITTGMSLT